MSFYNAGAELFVPDGRPLPPAVERTTHMGIMAHQDDLEFGCGHGILECFGSEDHHFFGVVVTDGAGSPRTGPFAGVTPEQMVGIRKREQKKAAVVGEYGALALLSYSSAQIKGADRTNAAKEIARLLKEARPRVVYTHNPMDKHDTHVAVLLATIEAIRSLPADERPERLLGCEGWRSLDWVCDRDKVVLDVSARPSLLAGLSGVFDSQIAGGKRYDLAVAGRRTANATYLESHSVDSITAAEYAVDMTPLVMDDGLSLCDFARGLIRRFDGEVNAALTRLL